MNWYPIEAGDCECADPTDARVARLESYGETRPVAGLVEGRRSRVLRE